MEYRNEKNIFVSRHTIVFNLIRITCFTGMPILSLIPLIEMNFSRIDFHIVLFEIFIILLQILFNYMNGYTISISNNYLVLSRTILLCKKIFIPKNIITRIHLLVTGTFRFTTYKIQIMVADKIQEYKFIELSKKSIEQIKDLEKQSRKNSGNKNIQIIRNISLELVFLLFCILCLFMTIVFAIKNMLQ